MYSKLIIKPVLTEKMAMLEERENKYAFFVDIKSNKTEIKKAVESKFDVKVLKVATIKQIGKKKKMTVRSGGQTIRTSGKRSDYKKAIITLDKDSKIDIMRSEATS